MGKCQEVSKGHHPLKKHTGQVFEKHLQCQNWGKWYQHANSTAFLTKKMIAVILINTINPTDKGTLIKFEQLFLVAAHYTQSSNQMESWSRKGIKCILLIRGCLLWVSHSSSITTASAIRPYVSRLMFCFCWSLSSRCGGPSGAVERHITVWPGGKAERKADCMLEEWEHTHILIEWHE